MAESLIFCIYLDSSVSEMHNNCRLRSEPLMEVRNPRNCVAIFFRDRSASLHKVLVHVTQKEVHEFHLFVERGWIVFGRVVELSSLAIHVVYVEAIWEHNQTSSVIIHNSDAVVWQLITKSILIRIVDPFTHPNHRLRIWIWQFICNIFLTLKTNFFYKTQVQKLETLILLQTLCWTIKQINFTKKTSVKNPNFTKK